MLHRGGKNGILCCALLVIGAAAILSLLPCRIWLMMVGIALIVLAAVFFRHC